MASQPATGASGLGSGAWCQPARGRGRGWGIQPAGRAAGERVPSQRAGRTGVSARERQSTGAGASLRAVRAGDGEAERRGSVRDGRRGRRRPSGQKSGGETD